MSAGRNDLAAAPSPSQAGIRSAAVEVALG